MANRNLTLTINGDLLDKARVIAAIRRSSVNEMVRGFLQKEVDAETSQAGRTQAWAHLFANTDAKIAHNAKDSLDKSA